MRMIIEARIEGGAEDSAPIQLAEFERADGELKPLGLNLAEGRNLVHQAQRALVNAQTNVVVLASRICRRVARRYRSKRSSRSNTGRSSAK